MPQPVPVSKKSAPVSLGIDLVEIKKAKVFYHAHRNRLQHFLTHREISYIHEEKKDPHKRLALLLAAKEAVFKALNDSGVGVAGFRRIEVTLEDKQLVSPGRTGLKISILQKNNRYVVVACHRDHMKPCVGTLSTSLRF